MGSPVTQPVSKKHPGFTIACCLFATVAFAQIIAVGVSIAARTGETREVIRYVASDPVIVSVPTLRDPQPRSTDIKPRSIDEILAAYADDSQTLLIPKSEVEPNPDTFTIQPIANDTPSIANPLVESLVMEAKASHVKGDLIATLTKLEEAEVLDPNEPAVFYGKAQLFEDMGQWDRATDNYEKLFSMGPSIGVLYHKAAFKLSNGINPEAANQDLFIIGNILRRISDDKLTARLTIPIRSTPNGDFDPSKLEVKVHHYDLVDNKKVEAVPPSRAENIVSRWLNSPPNWSSSEEFAESVYTIPKASASDVHIFGVRTYFGYVAELYYKNELVDQQAFPRRLHAIHGKQNSAPSFGDPYDFPLDQILPDINPDNPLLPSILPSY